MDDEQESQSGGPTGGSSKAALAILSPELVIGAFILAGIIIVFGLIAAAFGGTGSGTTGSTSGNATVGVADIDGHKVPATTGKITNTEQCIKGGAFEQPADPCDFIVSRWPAVPADWSGNSKLSGESYDWYLHHRKIIIGCGDKKYVTELGDYGPQPNIGTEMHKQYGWPDDKNHPANGTNEPYTWGNGDFLAHPPDKYDGYYYTVPGPSPAVDYLGKEYFKNTFGADNYKNTCNFGWVPADQQDSTPIGPLK